jgi:predicted alpha/beta hydrolase
MAAISLPKLDATAPAFTDVDINASDMTPIAARFYTPSVPGRGAVLLVPAMGVPQSFYGPLATWLAREGYHVATFDYRGMGKSRRGPLSAVDADIITWAEQDTAAVLRALAVRAPGLPITWIGHSLGGQIVPFVQEHYAVSKVITIAAGSGYWRENAAPLRRKVWIFWWLAVPITTPLFGYFPGKALGMVGDLPRGVVKQWRKWCLDPEYAGGEHRDKYETVATPITAISFTDDDMMSDVNTTKLHALYSRAPRKMLRLSPGDAGVKRIGHFGFFRPEMREPLWEALLAAELATVR